MHYVWEQIPSSVIKWHVVKQKPIFRKCSHTFLRLLLCTFFSLMHKCFHISRGSTMVQGKLAFPPPCVLPSHLHSPSTVEAAALCRWPVRRLSTVISSTEPPPFCVGRLLFCLDWVLSLAQVLAPWVLVFFLTTVDIETPQFLWVLLLWMIGLTRSEQGEPEKGHRQCFDSASLGWKPAV